MTVVWFGFVGLFVLRLIKHHGWEYVPLMLLVLGTWWYFGSDGSAGLRDGAMLAAIASVHLLTRNDITADRSMSER